MESGTFPFDFLDMFGGVYANQSPPQEPLQDGIPQLEADRLLSETRNRRVGRNRGSPALRGRFVSHHHKPKQLSPRNSEDFGFSSLSLNSSPKHASDTEVDFEQERTILKNYLPQDIITIVNSYLSLEYIIELTRRSQTIPAELKLSAHNFTYIDLRSETLELSSVKDIIDLCKNISSLTLPHNYKLDETARKTGFFNFESGDSTYELTQEEHAEITEISERIANLEKLTYLDASIEGIAHKISIVTNVLIELLSLKRPIQYLDVSGSRNLTFVGLRHLDKYVNLRYLNLHDCDIKDDCLTGIAELTHLISLNISNNPQITDAGLTSIKCRALTCLDLSSLQNINDNSIEDLVKLENIETLSIAHCFRLTNASLAAISNFSKLSKLNASGCPKFDNLGFKHLEGRLSFKFLDVHNCKHVSQTSLEIFASLNSLEELDISSTYVNTGSLHLLYGCKNLKVLKIRGILTCEEDVTKIKKEIPGIDIQT